MRFVSSGDGRRSHQCWTADPEGVAERDLDSHRRAGCVRVARRAGRTREEHLQTVAKKLFLINPSTGATRTIDIGSYDLANGDGLLLQGRTLYVVQNFSNKVAVFRLSTGLTRAGFVRAITDADFDVPTTIDRSGERLYVVNARFGTATPADQSYHVVKPDEVVHLWGQAAPSMVVVEYVRVYEQDGV